MFLIDAANPGFRVGRRIPTIDVGFVGGHSEVALRGCEVGADAVLGEPGRGLGHAQAAARPGAAHPLHALARAGAARARHRPRPRRRARGVRRPAPGPRDRAGADRRRGHRPRLEPGAHPAGRRACSTRAPTARSSPRWPRCTLAEAVGRVVDRAAQICGALGVSHDLPLARYMTEVRPFRIYDGPSEAHRWSIARRAVSRRRREREGERREPSRPSHRAEPGELPGPVGARLPRPHGGRPRAAAVRATPSWPPAAGGWRAPCTRGGSRAAIAWRSSARTRRRCSRRTSACRSPAG